MSLRRFLLYFFAISVCAVGLFPRIGTAVAHGSKKQNAGTYGSRSYALAAHKLFVITYAASHKAYFQGALIADK